ncbi:MAG TPA: hypothetical protein VMF68_00205 [Spirochaetia bacterium]|nr:hypothetical protein [Spirochaetia bacterium]
MNGRMRWPAAAAAALLVRALLSPVPAAADVPVRVEQLIYSLAAFDGGGYSSTFSLQTADSLYLLAGVDNLLSVRKTLVYWWPLTSEWKTDTDALNVQLGGTLEIRGGGIAARTLPLQKATWVHAAGSPGGNSGGNPGGKPTGQWKVLTGEQADRELARAQSVSDSYFAAVQRYQEKARDYDLQVRELGDRILALKNQGKDVSTETARLSALRRPDPPALPQGFENAPQPVQDWFVVNLPPGRYTVRLVGPDGSVIEGSDKELVVYRWRRTGGIGYEVIPGDRWTRPEDSKTPASVLYVNGGTGLYLRPFAEVEANDLFYQKTVSNQAVGNPSLFRWVRAGEAPAAVLELQAPGAAAVRSTLQDFTVKQAEGTGLGYTILPYAAAAAAGQPPSLVAIPLALRPSDRQARFRLLDEQGRPVPGSEREVRVVRPSAGFSWFALAALAPLAAIAAVRMARARRLRRP